MNTNILIDLLLIASVFILNVVVGYKIYNNE